MGYGLMSSALGWLDDGLGEGGPEQKFQGAQAPIFFFFGKILLAKNFFFWARGGGLGPLSLVPGSVPASGYAQVWCSPPSALQLWCSYQEEVCS